jgi:hypothetical protein
MIAGETIAGSASVLPKLKNFQASPFPGGFALSWILDQEFDEWEGILVVVLNGAVIDILEGTARSIAIDTTNTTTNRIEVVPVDADLLRIPNYMGIDYGDRAYLYWPHSLSSDVARYEVYSDAQTGTVDTDEAVASISRIAVKDAAYRLPTSGTGTGLCSIEGSWNAGQINREFLVQILSGNKFRHNLFGVLTSYQPFTPSVSYEIGGGLRIRFDGQASQFLNGDQYAFWIGPETFWQSEPLLDGNHKFKVRAFDSAGNASTLLADETVAIISRPSIPSDLSVAWNGTQITLTWRTPVGASKIQIFSNYSGVFGTLQTAIIDDSPMVTDDSVTPGTLESYSFTPAVDGVWIFRIEAEDSDGRISNSAALLAVNTNAPATTVRLNTPENVRVTPISGGRARVAWQYRIQDGEDCDEFAIYINTDPNSLSFTTPAAEVSASVISDLNYGIIELIWDSSALPGVRYITVRARAGSAETINTDSYAVTPDGTAPTLTGDLEGVPS